jgi:hypothetical protein
MFLPPVTFCGDATQESGFVANFKKNRHSLVSICGKRSELNSELNLVEIKTYEGSTSDDVLRSVKTRTPEWQTTPRVGPTGPRSHGLPPEEFVTLAPPGPLPVYTYTLRIGTYKSIHKPGTQYETVQI